MISKQSYLTESHKEEYESTELMTNLHCNNTTEAATYKNLCSMLVTEGFK